MYVRRLAGLGGSYVQGEPTKHGAFDYVTFLDGAKTFSTCSDALLCLL